MPIFIIKMVYSISDRGDSVFVFHQRGRKPSGTLSTTLRVYGLLCIYLFLTIYSMLLIQAKP